jgi:transposase-like protein
MTYLFLEGVSLRMRQPTGRKRVHMLVAYGVKADGTRELLAFQRSSGESQAAWEGLLRDLYNRGLHGRNLQLIVTDGCPGLAAAIPVVFLRAQHRCCWVHKMRNILDKVRQRDYDKNQSRRAGHLPSPVPEPKPEQLSKPFASAGAKTTRPWSSNWRRICPSYSAFSVFRAISSAGYARPV